MEFGVVVDDEVGFVVLFDMFDDFVCFVFLVDLLCDYLVVVYVGFFEVFV